MGSLATMSAFLRSRSEDQLAELLVHRSEVLRYQVTDVGQLASLLSGPGLLSGCLDRLDAGALAVCEILTVLDTPVARATALAACPDMAPAELDEALERLEALALAWRDDDQLRLASGVRQALPAPAGLGFPLRALLQGQSLHHLGLVSSALGLPRAMSAPTAAGAVLSHLSDPTIDRLMAEAPTDARDLLTWVTDEGPHLRLDTTYLPPEAATTPEGWLMLHGLLLPIDACTVSVPREVALRVLGGVVLTAFPHRPPPPMTVAVDPVTTDAAGADATRHLLAAVDLLADVLDATPATQLKDGGIGVRELRRVAAATGSSEDDTAVLLELLGAAHLVAGHGGSTMLSKEYDAWREEQPARRWLRLATTWVDAPYSLLPSTDEKGKRVPVLAPTWRHNRSGVAVRRAVLDALRDLAPGQTLASPAEILAEMRWRSPLRWSGSPHVDLAGGDSFGSDSFGGGSFGAEPFGGGSFGGDSGVAGPRVTDPAAAQVLHELAMLGITGGGALTTAGRHLLADDQAGTEAGLDAAVDALAAALPPEVGEVLLQADLTATVLGTPTRELTVLLDTVADRESRGAGLTWRFSPGSVRRALDAGHTADVLAGQLRAVAARGVPQPLDYLLADAARAHGRVRAGTAKSYLRSDDPALLAEIARTRALGTLGLRLLAPTVAVAGQPVATVLDALRTAGFAPAHEDAGGGLVVTRPPRQRAAVPAAHASAYGGGAYGGGYGGGYGGASSGGSEPAARTARAVARKLLSAPKAGTARAGVRGGRASTAASAAASATAWATDPLVHQSTDDEVDPGLAADRLTWLPATARAVLADALRTGADIQITYLDQRGQVTQRVIGDAMVNGSFLEAWCHLRQDGRNFRLSKIMSVTSVRG